jgi:hypothetical protein
LSREAANDDSANDELVREQRDGSVPKEGHRVITGELWRASHLRDEPAIPAARIRDRGTRGTAVLNRSGVTHEADESLFARLRRNLPSPNLPSKSNRFIHFFAETEGDSISAVAAGETRPSEISSSRTERRKRTAALNAIARPER